MKTPSLRLLLLMCLTANAAGARLDQLDGTVESLLSGDVDLYTGFVSASLSLGNDTLLDIQLETTQQQVDYLPNAAIDPFGSETSLKDNLVGMNASLEIARNRHQYSATATAYKGFRSFSSMWIDEYYRQQYSHGGIPGVTYEDPDPWGMGIDVAYRYEVLPASGFLTMSVAYLRDRVAPGYEIEDLDTAFELVRGESLLHTWTGSIEYEGVINRNARTRQALRITGTTSREPRISWNSALNYAIGERWISRTTASLSKENPDFESGSLSQTLEYSLGGEWALALTGRYYSDTGQIESANLVSSAAPALSSRQVFLSLRKSPIAGGTSFSLSVGPYFTRYDPTGIGTARFSGLYTDRDWWWGRIAIARAF